MQPKAGQNLLGGACNLKFSAGKATEEMWGLCEGRKREPIIVNVFGEAGLGIRGSQGKGAVFDGSRMLELQKMVKEKE